MTCKNPFWHIICFKLFIMKILNKIKIWYKKAYVRFVLLLAIAVMLYFTIPYLMFLLIMLGLTPGLIVCIVEIALERKPK